VFLSSAARSLALRAFKPDPFEFIASRLGRRWLHRVLKWIAVTAIALVLVVTEVRSSWFESWVFTLISHRMTFALAPGPSTTIRYTRTGPYDERLGYLSIPEFVTRAAARGYTIEAQARPSSMYTTMTDLGIYPIYQEKTATGLQVLGRKGDLLYKFRYPAHTYTEYSDVPPIVADTVIFIENRDMLDARFPERNPAIEWGRLSHAVFDYGVHAVNPSHPVIGGSTLATQLEKMRHSPHGRTHSASEKARQMISASLRAYEKGRDTVAAQRRIIRDYLNSLPLAAAPGHGEVAGLGDGLETWYGADFRTVNDLLEASPNRLDIAHQQQQARAFREVLSLLLAARAPSRYLVHQPDTLTELTDRYIRVLSKEGVISTKLRNLALHERPSVALQHASAATDFVNNKALDVVRTSLLPLLDLQKTYTLDRLDLSVNSTIDGTAQQNITQFLRRLTDPEQVGMADLRQHRLLAQNDPRPVIYAFTLYERGSGLNLLRVQTDNYNQPLNINEGTKLELGSTAKLRTLINYLQIVEELHAEYADASAGELRTAAVSHNDHLTRWAIDYLSSGRDKSLRAMLVAALNRRYSANPAEGFFTAGGLHHFRNFESSDDKRTVTVGEAFERSVNLVFIRLMRDIEHYYVYRAGSASANVVADKASSERNQYLVRFADEEGSVFLSRFYRKYAGLSPDEALEKLASTLRASPLRLAVAYRSARPEASLEEFRAFLGTHLASPLPQDHRLEMWHAKYSPDKFNLADRGYLAHVHPLELWLLWYLSRHPSATFAEVVNASSAERQQAYTWLFRTRYKNAQDRRIRILLEEDAFKAMWRTWSRLGYPFDRLVPSYATAIGVSGDTPAALAELMGIMINDGVRYPRTAIRQLRFAENTPMETLLQHRPSSGERVLSPAVVRLVRQELMKVVATGTARRACCVLRTSDGKVFPLGGKTGTGDNRVKIFARGQLRESRAVNRTAVFLFMIGDRFFGTVMVFVPGNIASKYEFTSSLPVQLFKDLEPMLMPLLAED